MVDITQSLENLKQLSNELSKVKIPNSFIRKFKGVDSKITQKVIDFGNAIRRASQLVYHGDISPEDRIKLLEELRPAEPIYLQLSYLESYQ